MQTIKTNDTDAFKTFEITQREEALFKQSELTEADVMRIMLRVLDNLDLAQIAELKQEAFDCEIKFIKHLEANIVLALVDHFDNVVSN